MPLIAWRQYRDWLTGHRVAVLGFAVTVAYWPTLLTPSATPGWAALAVGLPLVCSLDPRRIVDGMRWVILFMLALAALSLGLTPDIYAGTRDLVYMVLLSGAFMLGAEQESLDDLMNGVCAGLAVSCMLAFWQVSGGMSDNGRDGLIGDPPTGLFYSSEVFSELCALALAWAVVRGRYLTAVMLAAPIALSLSRVGMLAACFALAYAYWPRRWISRFAVLIGFIVLLFMLLFMTGLGKIISADHRFVLWGATIYAFSLFGHGLGWFIAAHQAEEFAHSDILQMIVELGAGALVMAAVPIAAFYRRRGNNAERALFVAVCVEVAISFPLHFPAAGLVAAACAGHLAGGWSAVRVGEFERRPDHGRRVYRRADDDHAGTELGGPVGGAVSHRSVSAREAALYPGSNRQHPAAAEGFGPDQGVGRA